jgi:general secretion pathway protein G
MNMRPRERNGRTPAGCRAFSLVEMLVVLVIIVILTGIVIRVAKHAQDRSAAATARAEIAQLMAALEEYRKDAGDYPRTDYYDANDHGEVLYCGLANVQVPLSFNNVSKVWGVGKVYFEFPPERLAYGAGGSPQLLDPWGNPYRYKHPHNVGNTQGNVVWGYALSSDGPDGTSGTGDDIGNVTHNRYGSLYRTKTHIQRQ